MTRLERIQTGDGKTVALEMLKYAAALMNGTAPVDVREWLEMEADDET